MSNHDNLKSLYQSAKLLSDSDGDRDKLYLIYIQFVELLDLGKEVTQVVMSDFFDNYGKKTFDLVIMLMDDEDLQNWKTVTSESVDDATLYTILSMFYNKKTGEDYDVFKARLFREMCLEWMGAVLDYISYVDKLGDLSPEESDKLNIALKYNNIDDIINLLSDRS